MRDNVEADGPEDYFRKSATVPFLDYMLNEMKTRFTDLHARTALFPFNIENIVPYLSPPPLPPFRQESQSGSAPVLHV
jgi:hypothetical protein